MPLLLELQVPERPDGQLLQEQHDRRVACGELDHLAEVSPPARWHRVAAV